MIVLHNYLLINYTGLRRMGEFGAINIEEVHELLQAPVTAQPSYLGSCFLIEQVHYAKGVVE